MPEVTQKEKVDFSLDNRQVFFLFFGLSVVGCFVFALGVMVGRRDDPGDAGPAVARAEAQQRVLDEPEPLIADAGYSFKDGLQHPATEGVPETRDPAVPPRDEDVVRAEREAALGKVPGKDKKSSKKLPPIPAPGKDPAIASAPKVLPPLAGNGLADLPAPPTAAIVDKTPPKDSIVASIKGGDPAAATAAAAKGKKGFTLQMKAFATQADADKLADKLKRNGHDVRVEAGEVNGRMWHRVRMGEFHTWDAALAAKNAFEKQEQLIAYVVSI
jgi:septal ring-binding cell division protein DamX